MHPTMVTITDIDVTPIVCPLDEISGGSTYRKQTRETIVVTLETDDGSTGRTYSGDFGDVGVEVRESVTEIIRDTLADLIVGQPLFATERNWTQMLEPATAIPSWESKERFCFIHAVGAVDTAIWDAIGKTVGQPLYRLWGGARESVPIIGIGGYYRQDKLTAGLIEEMERFEDMGLAGLKMKVGGQTPEADLERVITVREAMGEEFVIAPDANQGWTVDEATTFAKGARELGIEWFEEPVEWADQYRGMREIRRRTGVRVTAGQSEMTPAGCRRLIESEAVDQLNYDASWGGGPTAWLKVAHLAGINGVSVGHHEEPHLAMHLLAAVPNGTYVEIFQPEMDPVWHSLVADRPDVSDGRLRLPDRPGLGIVFDEPFIEEYSIED